MNFPKLPKKDKDKLIKWLEQERHQFLSEMRGYAACGNRDEEIHCQHLSNCIDYILMMMEYHEEK